MIYIDSPTNIFIPLEVTKYSNFSKYTQYLFSTSGGSTSILSIERNNKNSKKCMFYNVKDLYNGYAQNPIPTNTISTSKYENIYTNLNKIEKGFFCTIECFVYRSYLLCSCIIHL